MKRPVIFALLGMSVMIFGACNNRPKEKKQELTKETAVEPLSPNPNASAFVVSEERIYDIPVLTTSRNKEAVKKEAEPVQARRAAVNELNGNLAMIDVIPAKKVDTSFFCFQAEELNTTKTVISYQRKGEEVLEIISDPLAPDVVDYIVFTDKKGNTDVYGVNVGLTGKEARHLRRDLKHFVKKGKVFLYTEDSNILYELDGVTSEGQVVTDSDIDNMRVSALIWKDKGDRPYRK